MKKLSKSGKAVVISAAVLAALGAILAVLLLTSPKEEPSDSSAAEDISESLSITQKKADNVLKLTVENENGGFTFVRRERTVSGTDDSSNSTESTQYYWTSEQLEGVPQDDTKVLDFVNGLASFSAIKTVDENAADLEQFGLDKPLAKVNIEFDDDTTASFSLGIKNPVDESRVYMIAGDNRNVMLASYQAVEKAFSGVENFANLLLTKEYSSGENELEYLKIQRKDIEEPVEIEYMEELAKAKENEDITVTTSNTHRFVSPMTAELDFSSGRLLWYNLYGLTADSLAYVEQSRDNLEKCGLSEPFAKVNFKYGGEERVLSIGSENPEKTGYYCVLSTVPGIFVISKETAVWRDFSLGEVVSRRPLSPYIYACDSIEISTPTENYEFLVDKDNEKFTCGGKDIDGDEFRSFYGMLIGTIGEEYYGGEVNSDTPLVTVKFNYRKEYADVYGRAGDKLEFYADNDRKNAVKLNGDTLFRVSEIYTSRLISNINELLQGGKVNVDW